MCPSVNETFLHHLRKLTAKLLSALWILKAEGIIHSDIKPENIFLSSSFVHDLSPSYLAFNSRVSENHSKKRKFGSHSVVDLGLVSHDVDYILGDFGNAFLLSESTKFYKDFNIQSLPYRAPEVLCGVPFNHQIDLWSVGIVLLETALGRTLFSCQSREELFLAQCRVLTPPHFSRFAGGRYSRDLFSLLPQSTPSSPVALSSSHSRLSTTSSPQASHPFSDHYRTIYSLLISSTTSSNPTIFPSDLIHLIASLLYPDPDVRLNVQDALQHSFISSLVTIPLCLWNSNKTKGRNNKKSLSIETLRTSNQGQHDGNSPEIQLSICELKHPTT